MLNKKERSQFERRGRVSKKLDMEFFESSAKNKKNVEEIFLKVIEKNAGREKPTEAGGSMDGIENDLKI